MEKEAAIGAICILVGGGAMILTGELFLACCSLGMLYVFLKITGN